MPDLFTQLTEIGVPSDLIGPVMKLIYAREEPLTKHREKTRQRVAKHRRNATVTLHKKPNEINTPVTLHVTPLARVEDNLLNLELAGHKKDKKQVMRGSRIPDGFKPNMQIAQTIGLTLSQAQLEGEAFIDFWHAKPGAGGVKLDWEATWRNWCRTAFKRLPVKRRGIADVYLDKLNRGDFDNGNGTESIFGSVSNVELFPTSRSSEHGPSGKNVRGRIGWSGNTIDH